MNYKTLIYLLFIPLTGCHSAEAVVPQCDTVPKCDTVVPYVHQHPLDVSSLPKDYFAQPIKIPVELSATFAEIRSNHFHSGLDLRVGRVVGEPVYAAADGYVSRIKVSPWGGGKHIYITHPNGLRTVYMHLNDYCGELANFVHDYQYAHQRFAFDVDLPADSLKVTKGQLIAHAGNSGSSGGPHLHYEIRFADNDQTINPLYFGLPYSDPVAPTIANIKLYPADSAASIEGACAEWFQTSRKRVGKRYVDVTADAVSVTGRFYAGIYTHDVSDKSPRRNGVERIELYLDGDIFAVYNVGSFLFEETRSMNAHIDYPQYSKNREYYILSRVLPGVRYPKVWTARDNGYISFSTPGRHQLEYRVFDYKGNVTKRTLSVDWKPSSAPAAKPKTAGLPISYKKPFLLDSAGFRASIKPYTVYDNDRISFAVSPRRAGYIGSVYTIRPINYTMPPHQAYSIELTVPKEVSVPRNKLTIVNLKGKGCAAVETKLVDGRLKAEVKTFGLFTVALDTVAPEVKPSNFRDGASVTAEDVRLKITDNLSGIAEYSCFIGGSWVLAEYDPKVAALIIDSKLLKKGQNTLTVKVSDAVGNQTKRKYTLSR